MFFFAFSAFPEISVAGAKMKQIQFGYSYTDEKFPIKALPK